MFYVAYLEGAPRRTAAITLVFNVDRASDEWLHMARSAKRVVTSDNAHTPASPYNVVNTTGAWSTSATSFIDAPGAGSAYRGKDKEKRYGSMRTHAFADFINTFPPNMRSGIRPNTSSAKAWPDARSGSLHPAGDQYAIDLNGVIMLRVLISI